MYACQSQLIRGF